MANVRKWLRPTFILVVTVLLSLVASTLFTLRASRQTTERYVFVWEEEIARNLLVHGDARLFERIENQIFDLAPEVEATGQKAQLAMAHQNCFSPQKLQVTLYGTPAGELLLCRSPQKLILRSLLSPIFSFGIIIGLVFLVWRLRRTNREESQRLLSELAVRVAHDIRAPLMALKTVVGAPSSDKHESSKLIEAAISRISLIADDLLNRHRADASGSKKPKNKSLETSIQDIIREKKLTTPAWVTFEAPAAHPHSGLSSIPSSGDFERVLSNLLQNAIDAVVAKAPGLSESKPRIVIDAVDSGNEISIIIRDNGVGIPKDVLSKIGDVGFSFGKKNGNGVGLSSSRSWARDRGGELDVRSLEGTGTEVRLTLPNANI